jgi:hypothetical protein
LISKGDFPAELNIPLPFSLVSNDVSRDRLTVMPAYWFMYNMYALARNVGKYISRDKREDKTQYIEYDFLAPDSVNEIMDALVLLKKFTGRAYIRKSGKSTAGKDELKTGEDILENNPQLAANLEILAEGFEHTDRATQLLKVAEAHRIYRNLIVYYGIEQLVKFIDTKKISDWSKLIQSLPSKVERTAWRNIGGQLMLETATRSMIRDIRSGKIDSWDQVHEFYRKKSDQYASDKFKHAYASLLEVLKLKPARFTKRIFQDLLKQALATREWMVKNIIDSRTKDYQNAFRMMVYDTEAEMEKVIGRLSDNSFINQQQKELKEFTQNINRLLEQIK